MNDRLEDVQVAALGDGLEEVAADHIAPIGNGPPRSTARARGLVRPKDGCEQHALAAAHVDDGLRVREVVGIEHGHGLQPGQRAPGLGEQRQRGGVPLQEREEVGAGVAVARGQLAEAQALVGDVEEEVRGLRMPFMLGVLLNAQARLALAAGDPDTVTRVMTEAVRILAGLRDSRAIRYPLTYLATAAAMASEPRRAAVLYGAADAFSERPGNVSTLPAPQQVADRYRAGTTP
jgi:hypothetical protein